MGSDVVLSAQRLTKSYRTGWRRVYALADFSFELEDSEVVALIGPNGAGKTTLLHCLMGFLHPDEGGVRWGRAGGTHSVGFLAENFAFPTFLTVRQLLRFYDGLQFPCEKGREERIARSADTVGIGEILSTKIVRLSKGMRQLAGLAQAILGEPSVLVLDEPASGLDVKGRAIFRRLCSEWKANGRTVLFSTHVVSDVESSCDRILLLKGGRKVFDGEPRALLEETGRGSLEEALFAKAWESDGGSTLSSP